MTPVNRMWGALAVTAGLVGAGMHAVNAAASRTVTPSFWLLPAAAALGYGVLAVVMGGRGTPALRATVSGIAMMSGVGLLATEVAWTSPDVSGWVLWLGSWAWAPPYVAIVTVLPALLPHGRPLGGRWRWVPWAGVAASVAAGAWWALLPYEAQDYPDVFGGRSNPVGTDLAASLLSEAVTLGLLLVALTGAIASLTVRWRGAAGPERQQLKWVWLGVAATVTLVLLARLLPVEVGEVVAGAAMLPLPAAVGVAVLRYGLWEVDVVISRSVGYAAVALVAGVGYAAAIGAVGQLVGEQSRLTAMVTIAVLAPLLLPLHAALQRRVNRWVHGQDDEPWAELTRLGDALAAASDPDELVHGVLPGLVARIRRGMRAGTVTLHLVDGSTLSEGDPTTVATGAHTERLPLEYAGERLGELVVSRPGPLGASERAVLDRLTTQAAVAVHAVLMVRETRRARESVVLAREEERRRLRAELHDGVGPSVAALALHVETARELAREDPAAAAEVLERLAPRINAVVLDVRGVVEDLRPPTLDELGLLGATEELAVRLSGPTVRVEVEASGLGPLPAAVEVAAFRVVGEAVTNAVRHAGASRVDVTLRRDPGDLVAEVWDDGAGLPAVIHGGVGIASMRSRCDELGGRLVIDASTDGTRVEARLPLAATDAGPLLAATAAEAS
jgi:two-component system, NarL family, sensor kinase